MSLPIWIELMGRLSKESTDYKILQTAQLYYKTNLKFVTKLSSQEYIKGVEPLNTEKGCSTSKQVLL